MPNSAVEATQSAFGQTLARSFRPHVSFVPPRLSHVATGCIWFASGPTEAKAPTSCAKRRAMGLDL
jgi:hypothetical protein